MAGYHPRTDKEGEEIVYGGPLGAALGVASPPVAGMTLRRTMGSIVGARFVAVVDGQEVGQCECGTDLTQGGALPALRGWGELSELAVSALIHPANGLRPTATQSGGMKGERSLAESWDRHLVGAAGSRLASAGRWGAHDSGGDSRR